MKSRQGVERLRAFGHLPKKVLILGANYGLLPAVRLALAGHYVTVVCRQEEAVQLIRNGVSLRLTRRDGNEGKILSRPVRQGCSASADFIGVASPKEVIDDGFELAILAMAEPHYLSSEIADIIENLSLCAVPMISFMNIPPAAFLKRFFSFPVSEMKSAYESWDVWNSLDPKMITAASPDAQAVQCRLGSIGQMDVTLSSNFKIAPFERPCDQKILVQIAEDIKNTAPGKIAPPMRFAPSNSLGAPLSKWPMLLTGNYRCYQQNGELRSIADAVWADLEMSRNLYESVADFICSLGPFSADIVPFKVYASASRQLKRPSSVARALKAGALQIERVDRLIALAAEKSGYHMGTIQEIVSVHDDALDKNRRGA